MSSSTEYLGPFAYRQTGDCFPLGRDTVLLSEFAAVKPGWRVCDLGCGGGALALLLLAREGTLAYTGVELHPPAAALARDNLRANGLSGAVLTGDLRACRDLLPAEGFDLTVSNPPYFAAGSGKSGGAARMEESCSLDGLCAAAAWATRWGGRFALVYRPERLSQLLCALTAAGLEPKRLCLCQHDAFKSPFAILVEAVKGARPGLAVLPALITGERRNY